MFIYRRRSSRWRSGNLLTVLLQSISAKVGMSDRSEICLEVVTFLAAYLDLSLKSWLESSEV